MILTQSSYSFGVQNPYLPVVNHSLAPLPYPVYFVTKDPKWQPLIDNPALAMDDALYELCTIGHDMWSAQVYLDLKRSGLDVHLVNQPVPDKICVIPYYDLAPRDWLFRSYVVGCRYDTPRPVLCHHRTVMNPLQVRGKYDHELRHRPQPNLKPRHMSRGTMLENLVFKGHPHNLAAPFTTPAFLAALQALGVRFCLSQANEQTLFANWADYTEADAVIAVRNNTLYDIALKPALKLINAWFAGCPAILGPEPAYQAVRRSRFDYLEVRTPEEAIAALRYLKTHPDVYQLMVENGFRRAQDFTVNQVASQWRDLLAGPVAAGYKHWLEASRFQKQVVRPLIYGWQILENRLAIKHFQHRIYHGQRLLDEPWPKGGLVLPELASPKLTQGKVVEGDRDC